MFGIRSKLEEDIEETKGPGVFEISKKYDVKKWEVRMVEKGHTIDNRVAHTIEHYLYTYFTNVLAPSTYHVCRSECGTGFYILTTYATSKRTLLLGLLGAHAYINSEEEIPVVSEGNCQNPDSHDLDTAKKLFNKFYDEVLLTAESKVYEEILRYSPNSKQ